MSIPTPESPLDGRCNAIDGDTLYILSSSSFQSLPLKQNATWTKLEQGKPVTNPACIRVAPGGDQSKAALYVIGGTSTNSSYTGLQRYTFATKAWETLSPPTPDLVGRLDHSVAYIPSENAILSYAGSQPQSVSQYSSQTFVISTLPPYNIRSFQSSAPPGNKPILLNYDVATAVLIGSNTRDKEVWLFNTGSGWNKFSVELTTPIKPGVQGVLVDGADGSKVLTTYDATVKPNTINQIVMLGAGATPATQGQTIGGGKRKRDLTLANWPAYNSSAAPDVVRDGYTVSLDNAGRTVITGGNNVVPLNLFDNNANAWIDNGQLFNGVTNRNQIPLTTASSTSASATSTASSSSSSASASTTNASSSTVNPSASSASSSARASRTSEPVLPPPDTLGVTTQRVLGITLGVLGGIAVIFIALLFCIRRRRQKRRKNSPDYLAEKDRMSFQDRGSPHPAGSVTNPVVLPNHKFTQHNASHNSFNMVSNKARGHGSPAGRSNKRASSESTRQLVHPRKNDISGPVELDRWGTDKEVYAPGLMTSASGAPQLPVPAMIGAREDNLLSSFVEGKKRSSGWSRYFAGGDPQGRSGQDNSAYTSTTNVTNGSSGVQPSRIPSSAVVPLHEYINAPDGQRLSAVSRANPSFNDSVEDLARHGASMEASRGQKAHVHNAAARDTTPSRGHDDSINSDSGSTTPSLRSYNTNRTSYDEYSGAEGMATTWGPMDGGHGKQASNAHLEAGGIAVPRAPSSAYTMSYYGETGHNSRVISGARASSSRSNGSGAGFWPSQKDGQILRPSSSRSNLPSQIKQQQQTHFGETRPDGVLFPAPLPPVTTKASNSTIRAGDFDDRESTVTVFPKGVDSTYYAERDAARQAATANGGKQADMSWLNLGLAK